MAAIRQLTAIVLALGFLCFAQPLAMAKDLRGVALVIGEANYAHLAKLDNPKSDVRAMDGLLGDLGFDVDRVIDGDKQVLTERIADFVVKAKNADVALVYYSGHGIEADGSNFLVPVDADISTPQSAGASLVAVKDLLDQLAKTVPVTIVLLDACRTDAFPPGQLVQLPGSPVPVPVVEVGLGEERGPTPVAKTEMASDGLGMVIGFAAAPGEPALDGPKGENSPYAAALLKHLGAGGYSFGDVMTMVSEEVYLKTNARQLPWTNSSLRRVLSFGAPAVEVSPDLAAIADGRRKLLLSIANTPDDLRQQVEVAATGAAVPMDAIYGLLQTLGQEVPSDPNELSKLLKAQTAALKKLMADHKALTSSDPEIMRLSGLAQTALDEGALDVSVKFWEQAKARYATISESLDTTEADLRSRRLEGGEVLQKTADAYELKGDYVSAADNYRQAFEQVQKWDQQTAWSYKSAQARELTIRGELKGDNPALQAAIDAYGEAMRFVTRETDPDAWARTQSDLCIALLDLGQRESGTERLRAAVTACHSALEERSRERVPLDWAATESSLGIALESLGQRESGTQTLQAAVTAYRAALEERTQERVPLDWAETQNNLGNALVLMGQRESGTESLQAAVTAQRAALEERTRDRVPLDWAVTQNNLGNAFLYLGKRESGITSLQAAVTAYRAALEEATRDRVPVYWATMQSNLGEALEVLGERESGTANLHAAVTAFDAALEERTREGVPLDWARTQSKLGEALEALGMRESGTENLVAAVTAYRAALEERTQERVPLDWAETQSNLTRALVELSRRGSVGN